MVRSLFPILVLLSTPLFAQQPDNAAMMQQLQRALQTPEAQQAMQAVMQNQTIDLSAYPGWNNHDCDETKLRDCAAGYECAGGDGQGNGSAARILGRENGRCHVQLENTDGSRGECRYSDQTIESLLLIHDKQKVTMQEALAVGQMVASECQFADAQGKPLGFEQMQPAGTNARQGAGR